MILVTGGTGYLGNELARKLKESGEKVRVLARKQPENPNGMMFAIGDITDPRSLDKAMKGVDIVYHLAALVDHFAGEEELQKVNVQGSVNVVEAAIRNGVRRLVYCSSVSAEKGGGSTRYGRSKIRAEKEIMKFSHKIDIIIIRPGPMYDEDRKSLRKLVLFAKYLHVFGLIIPDTVIHLASRRNVVNALLLAKKKGVPGHAYAVCDKAPIKRSQLSLLICKKAKALPIPIPLPLFYPILYLLALFFEALSPLGIKPLLTREFIKVLTRERKYEISLTEKELGYIAEPTESEFSYAVEKIIGK